MVMFACVLHISIAASHRRFSGAAARQTAFDHFIYIIARRPPPPPPTHTHTHRQKLWIRQSPDVGLGSRHRRYSSHCSLALMIGAARFRLGSGAPSPMASLWLDPVSLFARSSEFEACTTLPSAPSERAGKAGHTSACVHPTPSTAGWFSLIRSPCRSRCFLPLPPLPFHAENEKPRGGWVTLSFGVSPRVSDAPTNTHR
ncbi:hypothetical protein Tb927.8.5920 [Trypanosoma brucei brucei TREU927]|uniref:Uncharacterized protein n=1 Tax=Trypanosoma brucei brucei (strain 927/4 GUTat10.1) TaxID=185431 RepID=Q57YJ3_TRYB2|nr:hypothetical protein Tb927.8.5920 [Trypanosoma brucei brucei TREU927]AAX69310.1 hypothetical protein Tb927.8.5920 [Trypanosoma brucei]AAZ13356.1 hypothetical protein Tb927.8.5920 [Trypanosoma brucei brucei TREU927]